MVEKRDSRPLTYKLTKLWAFIFAAFFLIYGGVKIVLGFLDHNYDDMAQPIIFLLLGGVLIGVAYAYRELKTWGWYGQIGINGLVVILAVIGHRHYLDIVTLVISALALYALFSSATKAYVLGGRQAK